MNLFLEDEGAASYLGYILGEIQDNINKINSYQHCLQAGSAEAFSANTLLQDVMLLRLMNIARALKNITGTKASDKFGLISEFPDIPWEALKEAGDTIAADYYNFEASRLWKILYRDLPAIEKVIRKINDAYPDSENACKTSMSVIKYAESRRIKEFRAIFCKVAPAQQTPQPAPASPKQSKQHVFRVKGN